MAGVVLGESDEKESKSGRGSEPEAEAGTRLRVEVEGRRWSGSAADSPRGPATVPSRRENGQRPPPQAPGAAAAAAGSVPTRADEVTAAGAGEGEGEPIEGERAGVLCSRVAQVPGQGQLGLQSERTEESRPAIAAAYSDASSRSSPTTTAPPPAPAERPDVQLQPFNARPTSRNPLDRRRLPLSAPRPPSSALVDPHPPRQHLGKAPIKGCE